MLALDKVDLRKASIPHPEMTPQELETLVDYLNRKFNSSLILRNPRMFVKKYVVTIIKKRSFRVMKRLFSRQ